jgi:hypothetical protein
VAAGAEAGRDGRARHGGGAGQKAGQWRADQTAAMSCCIAERTAKHCRDLRPLRARAYWPSSPTADRWTLRLTCPASWLGPCCRTAQEQAQQLGQRLAVRGSFGLKL